MMYSHKMAAAIKVDGKVLREFNDVVYVPYGKEYTILVKNLHTVRSIIDIFIDGKNAVPNGLILGPLQEINLERWIKNGNLLEGNRFKFIERTRKVEQHRGIGIEDGLIRIEHRFERIVPTFNNTNSIPLKNDYYHDYSKVLGIANTSVTCDSSISHSAYVNMASCSSLNATSEVGITVPGSHSTQKFRTGEYFLTESQRHSMIIKLLGETEDNRTVREPITVKHKPRCQTCGTNNRATAKFCSECGTSLTMFV